MMNRRLQKTSSKMIEKSEQQDIDREGKRLIREALERLGWVMIEIHEDYGVDYDVQIFVDGNPNGLWFKIQLKSSASNERSADGKFISVQLDLDHARHYAIELRDPIFLVHVDVQTKDVFWVAPQLDNELIRKLNSGENSSTITVRVPTSNLLPTTAEQVLKTVEGLYVVLGQRTLASSSIASFADSLKYQPGEQKLRDEIYRKSNLLRLRRIRELFVQRQYAEARERARLIISDPDSLVEDRFWAQEMIGSIDWGDAVSQNRPQAELPLIYLENANALQRMSASGPSPLKMFALIARKAAELDQLAVENWGLTILLHQHRTPAGNPFMALNVFAAHALSTRAVIKKYNQCLRLVRYAANFRGRWFLPRALAKIPMAAASFIARIGRMEEAQLGDGGAQFRSSILSIAKLIAQIGEESCDQEAISLAIGSALITTRSADTDTFKWVGSALDRITDPEVRAESIGTVERQMMRWKGQRAEGDYNPDPYVQLLENAAASLGIDVSDKSSPLYQALLIAAKDNSPERVLRTCEHIMTSLGATGPVARQVTALLGTQMAGSKMVHCSLHDYHLEGRDFDSALAAFKLRHCDSCPDKAPRSPAWEFTDSVRDELQTKHEEFVRKFNATGAGFRFTSSD
jgi:hypothetical protein